jgi:hypothetical protein
VAALATGFGDGSTTVLTVVGATPGDPVKPELLGVVRLDSSGRNEVWEADLPNPGGAEWSHMSLAVTPDRGTVFLAGTCSGDCPDFGKGKATGNVLLKFDADNPTVVAWQQSLAKGTLTSNVAVDDAGSAVVAVEQLVTKFRFDQTKLWEKNAPKSVRAIAIDKNHDVVIACESFVFEKHAADDGTLRWTNSLKLGEGAGGSFSQVGLTELGTVVLAGSFHGTVSFGGDSVNTATQADLLAVAEANGDPRFLMGVADDPTFLLGMAVDASGSVAALRSGGPERCGERVTKFNLDKPNSIAWGPVKIASCDPATSDLTLFSGDAAGLQPGSHIAVDPSSHDIRIGGGMHGTVNFGATPITITSRGGVDGIVVDLVGQ